MTPQSLSFGKMADPKACTHSRSLFVLENGSPMRFYARPGPLKRHLSPIILHGGGVMCRLQEPGALLLAKPGEAQGPQYISINYVTDCVERDERLDVKDYVLEKTPGHTWVKERLETGCREDHAGGDKVEGAWISVEKENQNNKRGCDDVEGSGKKKYREVGSKKDDKAEKEGVFEDECREVDNTWKQKNSTKYQRKVPKQTDEKDTVKSGAILVREEIGDDVGEERQLKDGGCQDQVEALKDGEHQQGKESLKGRNGQGGDEGLKNDRGHGGMGSVTDEEKLKDGEETLADSEEGRVAADEEGTAAADEGSHGEEGRVVADEGIHGQEVTVAADEGIHGQEVTVAADEGIHGQEGTVAADEGIHGQEGTVAADEGIHGQEGTVAADEGIHCQEGTVAADEGIHGQEGTVAADEGIHGQEATVAADEGIHGEEGTVAADEGIHGEEGTVAADEGIHGEEGTVAADEGSHGEEVTVAADEGSHGEEVTVAADEGSHGEEGTVAADEGSHGKKGREVDGKNYGGDLEGGKPVMDGEDEASDAVDQEEGETVGLGGDRAGEEGMMDRQYERKQQTRKAKDPWERGKQSYDANKNDVQQKRQRIDNVHQINSGTKNIENKKTNAEHLQEKVTPDSPSFRPTGRTFFTQEEDMAILSYLRDNVPARGTVSGVVLWKEMEEKQVVKRTWQAMKDRYRKHLAKTNPFYKLPKSPSPLEKKTSKNEVSSPRASTRKTRKISSFTYVKCSTPKRSKVTSSEDRPGCNGEEEEEEEGADLTTLSQHQDTAELEDAIQPSAVSSGIEKVADMNEDRSNEADNSDSGELCIFEIANMEFEADDASEAVASKQGPGLKEFVMEEDSVTPESQTQVDEVSSSPDVSDGEGLKEAIHDMMAEFNLRLCDVTQALLKNSGEVGSTRCFLRTGSRPDGYPIWLRNDDLDLEKEDPKIQKRLINKYGADNVAKRVAFLTS
ncbi:telomeric repeat-binding factor 2-interacting protein 1 [Spea bombifrons]|uniref:telomeric repeat-binding factor 2-interacting protein 1 n=1 Tax=Spea bombifrons TaxID=233779 RepID=UPI00234B1D52|nr:telomeric repeat-binding factor 2-interacting protein 1 [Spea bombifrons]